MKKTNNPFEHFSNFVLRTPVLTFNFYEELTARDVISNDIFKKAYNDPLIKEACFLASPTLYFGIEKWLNGELNEKKERKIRFSLLKYLTRMSTRCIPFGLFAGCSLGNFDSDTSIISTGAYSRHTRLDMNYLVALSLDLSKQKKIRSQLLFFPNSSIYVIGSQIRYIEYYYTDSRRQHHIVEIDNSDYLKAILKRSKSGAYLDELISLLIENGILSSDAKSFINELLESQVLVSELEPSVSGPKFMIQILEVLKNLNGVDKEIKFLNNIQKQLDVLDGSLGNTPKKYITLSEYLKKKTMPFDPKYLFQTDMELRPKENKLSSDIASSIKKGMLLLNKLTPPITESNLSRFKDSFYERYGEREIPLAKALDVETGIGYLQHMESGDVNPLVDDIFLPFQEDAYNRINIDQNNIHRILERKLISCDKRREYKIILTDNDFKDFPMYWDNLPDTLSTMIEVIYEDGEEKIKFSSMGGSSAANLLGRFCHGDTALNRFAQSITDLERNTNPDKILAEILHLPEARVGNILMRPSFREFEIPYLAKSNLDAEHQIMLGDLFLSVKNDKIILRSKKLDKEIIPHLTNAHNYSANALPIYQFLCDMQTQNLREGIYFGFGFLENNRSFLPRVEYGNLIFYNAKWKIKKEDITSLLSKSEDLVALQEAVDKWREEIKLPQYALLGDGDKQLLINFNNVTSIQMLLDMVKNRIEFELLEFLFSDEALVKSDQEYYTHQIVVSFYNNKKLTLQNDQNNG